MALAGAAGQLIFAGVMLVVWLMTGSLSALPCAVFVASGIPVWLMTALMFYCRQLERQEAGDLEELAAQGRQATTIFQQQGEEELRPAAARAAFVAKWLVPVFTLLWAGMHVAIGVLMLRYARGLEAVMPVRAGQGILLSLVAGFAAFLLSRYSTGMSGQVDWRPLRAAGSYLLIGVLYIAAVLAGLIAARQEKLRPDLVIAFIGPVLQLILSAELVLNFVLDLYRPRMPGQEHRPSFDSRLFGMVAEPEKVGHSIADTLNYQFGFEVSKTWFYQLVAKAALPLLLFGVLVMMAMTSIMVVSDGEQFVVTHLGRLEGKVGPGISFKWPWPIDKAQRFETDKVHQLLLGVGGERKPVIVEGKELYLWTEEHGARDERDFIVAAPPRSTAVGVSDERKPPPPVNLIKLVVDVQYVISDPVKFGYRYLDSARLLECEAYREMVRYCASATLDTPLPGSREDRLEAMMTYGQGRVAEELKRRIQAKADELGLGVDVRSVGLRAVHPPAEAAQAYEDVLKAERGRLLTRYEAEGDADKKLVEVAGTPLAALKLALAIRSLEELERLRDDPDKRLEILDELIGRSTEEITALQGEIEQERLLGQIREGEEATDKQKLCQEHLAHLSLLKEIKAAPTGVDLNAAAASARDKADELFSRTVGEPASQVANAEAYRAQSELTEMARSQAFASNLLAYEASPTMYMMDRWLDVLDEVLPNITKYVMGVDRDKLEVWLNLERQTDVMEGANLGNKEAK